MYIKNIILILFIFKLNVSITKIDYKINDIIKFWENFLYFYKDFDNILTNNFNKNNEITLKEIYLENINFFNKFVKKNYLFYLNLFNYFVDIQDLTVEDILYFLNIKYENKMENIIKNNLLIKDFFNQFKNLLEIDLFNEFSKDVEMIEIIKDDFDNLNKYRIISSNMDSLSINDLLSFIKNIKNNKLIKIASLKYYCNIIIEILNGNEIEYNIKEEFSKFLKKQSEYYGIK